MSERDLLKPEAPKSIGLLTNSDILFGSPTPPIDKLKVVSDSEFEDIIREWISGYCKSKYISVWRAGGANDKGRDVIAYIDDKGNYDNYQSKHYDHPLMPSDVWQEFVKLCYYTFNDDFKLPKKYYFVSPQGVGPKLGDLINNPEELKKELFNKWNEINTLGKNIIILSDELREHITAIDFSMFDFLDPQDFIEQHKQTSYFAARFGGGLQNRREKPVVNEFDNVEYSLRFVDQLFKAYSEHHKIDITTLGELNKFGEQLEHFNRNRNCFYWAEALDQFGRDRLPYENTCFEDLKEEIYQGVIDVSNSNHSSGYERVKNTTQEATKLSLQSNALLSVAQIQDKIGICHHLVNDAKLTWVE